MIMFNFLPFFETVCCVGHRKVREMGSRGSSMKHLLICLKNMEETQIGNLFSLQMMEGGNKDKGEAILGSPGEKYLAFYFSIKSVPWK